MLWTWRHVPIHLSIFERDQEVGDFKDLGSEAQFLIFIVSLCNLYNDHLSISLSLHMKQE